MDVIGICPYDGSILLVHFSDLPDVLMALEDIVVSLMPICCNSELGPREFGQWMKVDAVYGKT